MSSPVEFDTLKSRRKSVQHIHEIVADTIERATCVASTPHGRGFTLDTREVNTNEQFLEDPSSPTPGIFESHYRHVQHAYADEIRSHTSLQQALAHSPASVPVCCENFLRVYCPKRRGKKDIVLQQTDEIQDLREKTLEVCSLLT